MRTLGRWLVADLVARYVLAPIAARILTARQWRLIGKERVQAGGRSTYTTVGSGSFANLQGIDHGVRRPGKAA